MFLLEFEAKEILKKSGLKVPEGIVFSDIGQIEKQVQDISFPAVVKGQVATGGRGKAGAVRIVNGPNEFLEAFKSILGMNVKGNIVASVLVERYIRTGTELYLAIMVDRYLGRPLLIAGRKGGIDVERSDEQDFRKIVLDPLIGVDDDIASKVGDFLGTSGDRLLEIRRLLKIIWTVFSGYDCELIEINPLAFAEDQMVCLDAKIVVNDDSLFRHGDLALNTERGRTPYEIACRMNGFSGVELSGNVVVIANGAGLTMAVLDMLEDIGLKGAAFLDLGGADDPDMVAKAISIVLDKDLLPNIEGLMICIFGGLTQCDIVASGIINSFNRINNGPQTVIRLRGNNEAEGNRILSESGFVVHSDLGEACQLLGEIMKGRP